VIKSIDPADSHQLDGLLRRHRIELKHGLGQNFLTDPAVRDVIAEAAGITTDDEVLEVGSGVGTLTVALAPRARRLVAVELDGRLIPALRESLVGHDNVEVVRTDILRFNIRSAFPNGNEIVAGNIPYNLTGALIQAAGRPTTTAPPLAGRAEGGRRALDGGNGREPVDCRGAGLR
jgi:16S rRNA A1518/A1519 N6-dimethyltransferase RsmA/KsgA/DIM1 with predicted DNA glycosylase/AP lyase activity